MKYLITTSLLTSIIIVIAIPNLLNSILLLTAGGVSLYWSLSYFITMQKEILLSAKTQKGINIPPEAL